MIMSTIMAGTTKEIIRYGQTLLFKDEGLDGYTIEFPDTEVINLMGVSYITFGSFDDYFKFYNIDNHLYFLYPESYHSNSCMARDDEMLFYNILKEIEKIIKDCKNMKIESNNCAALYMLFMHIKSFVEESEDGFKHKNKKLEKKFNKLAKELDKLCDQ